MTGDERDRLERAIDELRAFARAVPAEAEATRRRLLDEGPAARRRRGVRGALVGLALVVFGAPALAQVTGQWPALVEAIAGWVGEGERSGAGTGTGAGTGAGTGTGVGTGAGTGTGTEIGTGDEDEGEDEGEDRGEDEGEDRGEDEGEDRGEDHDKNEDGLRVRAWNRAVASHGVDRARALYLSAHRAHFGGADSEVALRAWDEFLRAAPGDPFAPEARYNRAILLVKLGRLADAVDALAGFACAAPGSYRQREAAALIARARAAQPRLAAPACGSASP